MIGKAFGGSSSFRGGNLLALPKASIAIQPHVVTSPTVFNPVVSSVAPVVVVNVASAPVKPSDYAQGIQQTAYKKPGSDFKMGSGFGVSPKSAGVVNARRFGLIR